MAKGITASEMGKRGGTTRAHRYSKEQISKWGKLGGRPPILDRQAMTRVRRMLANAKTQAECAKALGVSSRTIGRVVAGMKKDCRNAARLGAGAFHRDDAIRQTGSLRVTRRVFREIERKPSW